MPRLWSRWPASAGCQEPRPLASLTPDHFCLAIQAAIGGLGVAMAPTTLIEGDIATGRLATPFPGTGPPARACFPQDGQANPAGHTFSGWLATVPEVPGIL